ncbi:hypothetical protein [Maribacter sp. HTCC2170]|uniref:hypothetical protein n=1 Tax=Maribacter sp. (strain HTCC2170 / KCCM 42371) TaxID=313603 RepID=UPI00006AFCBC|nr:hypothetical protein [Maribacter sp. HTCC2170]EAR01448.1 hypothetical protein FB2170_12026 [Maribacter sp. HTCC2170]
MKKVYLLLWSIVLFTVSCSDETTVFNEPQDDLQLEKSQQILENSISYDYSGVLDIAEEDSISGKYAGSAKAEEAGDFPLTLVAQIDPPSYSGGQNLTASHVHVDGDFAYVSYNTVEDGYAGGIDVINISNPIEPKVSSRLYYTNADVNSIEYNDGYVYAVGGVDSEKSVRATANSFIAKIPTSGGKMNIGAGITYGFQEGFNSTDVEVTASTVVVSSGGDGFITVYDKRDLSILKEAPFQDLRSVSIYNNQFAVLDASKGVSILDGDLNITNEIAINTDFGVATKRTLEFQNDKVIVSEGTKGAGIYNVTSGSLIEYLPILIDPAGTSTEGRETNAVAMNDEVILMANGGAGLCLSEDKGSSIDLVGVIGLDGSINFVESKGDYIFAASGKNGLQVIKLNRPSESLAAECSTLDNYSGSSKLFVNEGDDIAFRGSKRFNKIEVEGSLLMCGTWTVRNDVDVKENGLMEMNGTLVVGNNKKRKKITVEEGAVLRIEGNLTIYGDLELKDNSTIEFLGANSVVNIIGDVNIDSNVTITGDFDDVRNKF